MSHHLGYPAGADKPDTANNQRNGKSGKTLLTGDGPLRIDIPRDREGEFEPKLIGKHERRFTAFDDKIIAMYNGFSRHHVSQNGQNDFCLSITRNIGTRCSRTESFLTPSSFEYAQTSPCDPPPPPAPLPLHATPPPLHAQNLPAYAPH